MTYDSLGGKAVSLTMQFPLFSSLLHVGRKQKSEDKGEFIFPAIRWLFVRLILPRYASSSSAACTASCS
ncbi:hypothetical protein LC593_18800 [Nostoc sp. CHAB 5844]|nr:hypothetical protein [Nostoc sp. CHAB 5844]